MSEFDQERQPATEPHAESLTLERWAGYCNERFRDLGFESVDDYIDAVRGR